MKELDFEEIAQFQPKQIEAWNTLSGDNCKYLLYGGAMHGGKFQPLDATVWTPFGPKPMGEIEVGDQVSHPSGLMSRVVAVHPQGVKQIYRVTFDDGATCEVGLEHLWQVRESCVRRFRKKPKADVPYWRVCTTEQILADLARGKRILIPISQPVPFTVTTKFKSGRWPVAPYTLGAFLGDGHIGYGARSITCADEEIINRVVAEGYKYISIATKEGGRAKSYYFPADVLKAAFESLGLNGCRSWEKFIPAQYKVAPLSVRRFLLQGLMDTDGYADSRGHVSYSTTSRQLAEDVRWIAQSLGYKIAITSKIPTYHYKGKKLNGREAFTVWFRGGDAVRLFSLSRKYNRAMNKAEWQGEYGRRFVSIEYSRDAEAQCISVDNPDGLYLTDNFIVTHNSYFLRWCALGLAMYYSALAKAPVPVGLFSEDYPTLKDRQISKMAQEFTGWGELKATQEEGLCFFVSPRYGGGRILLRNLDDPSKYMSTEFAAILVEELTKDPLDTFINLRTRLRFPGINNVKFVAATNPGGIGHVWCKSFWIDRNSGDPEQAKFRYVKATLRDNKYTTQEYENQLATLPERLQRAYRDGDWEAFEGQFFNTFDRTKQLILPFEIPQNWELVGSLDPGWAGICSFGLQARDFNGCEYRIGTYYQKGLRPEENAEGIVKFIKDNKYTQGRMPRTIVSGVDAWAHKDRFAVIASSKTFADVFQDAGLYLQKATIDRHQGWGSLRAVMPDRYKIFKQFNTPIVNQLTVTLADESDVDDIQGKGNDPDVEDHAIDDARYGNLALYRPGKKEEVVRSWEDEIGEDQPVASEWKVGDP